MHAPPQSADPVGAGAQPGVRQQRHVLRDRGRPAAAPLLPVAEVPAAGSVFHHRHGAAGRHLQHAAERSGAVRQWAGGPMVRAPDSATAMPPAVSAAAAVPNVSGTTFELPDVP